MSLVLDLDLVLTASYLTKRAVCPSLRRLKEPLVHIIHPQAAILLFVSPYSYMKTLPTGQTLKPCGDMLIKKTGDTKTAVQQQEWGMHE